MAIRRRDVKVIDALEAYSGANLQRVVWRIAREGRDPTTCSAAGGRWDDATFEVLYTSLSREGALAEMHFHLKAGQPVVPSKLKFVLYEIEVELNNALDLSDQSALTELGYDLRQFGRLSYEDRAKEYPQTQDIAEAAHFLGYDGMLVPSARSAASNLVIFCQQIGPDQMEVAVDHGVIDWTKL